MSNRDFNKKFAIALSAALGAGALNCVPMSAMEVGHVNQKKINDEYILRNVKSIALESVVMRRIIEEQARGKSFLQAINSVRNKIPDLIKTELEVGKDQFSDMSSSISWYYGALSENLETRANFLVVRNKNAIKTYINNFLENWEKQYKKNRELQIDKFV